MSIHLTTTPLLAVKDLPASGQVLVFRTSVRNRKDVRKIEGMLNQLVDCTEWSFDLADVDKVLRIEAHSLQPESVIQLLEQAGYCCAELPD